MPQREADRIVPEDRQLVAKLFGAASAIGGDESLATRGTRVPFRRIHRTHRLSTFKPQPVLVAPRIGRAPAEEAEPELLSDRCPSLGFGHVGAHGSRYPVPRQNLIRHPSG